MLTVISWNEYLAGVAFLILAYYLFVGIRYYPRGLRSLFRAKRKMPMALQQKDIKNRGTEIPEAISPEAANRIGKIIGGLKDLLAEAVKNNMPPEECKLWIQRYIRICSADKNTLPTTTIIQQIAAECKKYGLVAPSEEEVEKWWDG